jgi:Cu2+-exporting ATPase
LHCGLPLATEAARTAGFCCAGCAYVWRLVHEHGLEGYYKIKDAVLPPVDQVVFQPRDYAWLGELQAAAEKFPGPPGLDLEVQGISCAGCVWLIERIFHQQPGALAIETDAQLGRMHLRWAAGRFDAPGFARTLQTFSYLVGPPGEEPAVPESRRLARRIGLCSAFALNVMLFTLPVYFGMKVTFAYAHLFGTLALVFATLSLLTGGSYFLNRAARALREGVMHIDLPIAVGIVGAYAGSLYGWLTGRAAFVYFDFVATFILLMLVGRWAQVVAVERNRRRLLSASARPQKVGVPDPATGRLVPCAVETLRPGGVFAVRSGQVVPVEAQLETAAATFGTGWITGEADPRACRAGARVPAGAINLGRGEIRLRAVQGWSGSLLAQLLRPAERDAYRHRFLERVISGYLIAIFVLATATGAGWWLATHDAAVTWAAVTAVLVVSCPCAIGLAFPLADEMATTALRRHGVFVREADVWPRLGRVRKIIFDKTGTLTLETPVLANPGALASLAPPARAALLSLVRDNPHPVGQSLYENLLAAGGDSDTLAGTFREEPGYGIALQSATGLWSLGRPGWRGGSVPAFVTDDHDTEFACDGVVLTRLFFTDAVREDARAEIAALRARGLESYILSGDRREKVAAMTAALGLPVKHGVAEVSPEGKAAWVRLLDDRDTLMLGDGANDSLAFDAAFVRGTPVIHRGVLEGKADFYYLGRGVAGIRRLFEVNAARRRTQRWLLVFSIAYNTLAVGLAAAGRMNPLVAAILMPGSSLLSLAIVVAGMRRWLPAPRE